MNYEEWLKLSPEEQDALIASGWHPGGQSIRAADEDMAGGRNTITRFADADACTALHQKEES